MSDDAALARQFAETVGKVPVASPERTERNKVLDAEAPVRPRRSVTPEGLFEMDAAPAEPVEVLSAGQRRRIRQERLVASGHHPLLVALFKPGVGTTIHPQAPADCSPEALRNRAFTCGSCVFRQPTHGGARSYPKCHKDEPHRITHGEGTDVRAWWPACRDYENKGKETP